jgi:hypothetical protein
MAQERDKSSIFLTVVIVFLLIAMGVYGFIYRDKISEFAQKYTKKKENIEKISIKNQPSDEEDKSNSLVSKKENNETTTNPKNEEIVEKSNEKEDSKTTKKDDLLNDLYENVPGDEPDPKAKKPINKLVKSKKSDLIENLPESDSNNNTVKNTIISKKSKTKKINKLTKKGKKKYSSKKKRKVSGLQVRVSKLERAMGIKPKKGERIEKRISRLEKLISKKKSKKKKK